MKPTERELPPGLPPLPPGTRYAGQLKDYTGNVDGHTYAPGLDDTWDGPQAWEGTKDILEVFPTDDWHLAVPIEDMAEPKPQDTEVARIKKTLETLIAWSVRDLSEAGVKQLLDMLNSPTEPKL